MRIKNKENKKYVKKAPAVKRITESNFKLQRAKNTKVVKKWATRVIKKRNVEEECSTKTTKSDKDPQNR